MVGRRVLKVVFAFTEARRWKNWLVLVGLIFTIGLEPLELPDE
jgi:hypothetical protein